MPLDLKRLTSDAKATRKKRLENEKVRTFSAIQSAMKRITKLRAAGVRWREIAEALAAQGIEQGTGDARKPLTASRLTSIVNKLQAADQRRAEKLAGRGNRSDLSKQSAKSETPVKLQLSNELALHTEDATTITNAVHEDAEMLRRERLANVRAFTKDGKKE
jgi:DNA-binding transcriptional MerR regulator